MIPRSIFFEAHEDGGGPAVPDLTSETDAQPDGEVGAAVSDETQSAAADQTEAAAPTWTPDSPEFQDAVSQAAEQYIEGLLRQASQAEQNQPPSFELDPLDDNFGPNLQGAIQAAIQQAISPIMPMAYERQAEQANAQVGQILDSFKDLGEFNKEAAQYAAAGFIGQAESQYGRGPRAAQAALRQGAEYVSNLVKGERQSAVDAYKASLQAASGTQSDPGVSGAAGEQSRPATSYEEILQRHTDRARVQSYQS